MPSLVAHQSDSMQTLLFKLAYNLADPAAIRDSVVAAFASLSDEQKTAIAASLSVTSLMEICGGWDASTNTPTLVSGQGDIGNVYIVSVDGTTTLDGLTNWKVGDMAMFSGTAWLRVAGATVAEASTTLSGIVKLATNIEAAAGLSTAKVVTPAGVKAYVDGLGIKTVALTGAYGDLTNKPTLFSGSYTDLTNKPTIPAAQVQSDWNAVSGMGVILNKPVIPTITGSTGTLYSNYGVGQSNNTGNYTNLFGNGLNGLGALKLNAHGSNHTYASATVVTGACVFGDNIFVLGSTLGEACAFGRNVIVVDGGAAFGAAANAALNGTAVGPCAHAGTYSLSLGYGASQYNSVANRTEIAPTNNVTITHRLSGQSNGAWQMTFPATDTAPTTVTQAFGNANGTLPQGMYQLRVSTTGIPTIDQNVGGVITSTPVSHRQIVDINAQTGTTYTTVAADAGKVVTLNNAGAITVTLSALPAGARCVFEQLGAGQVTFVAGSGNTLRHVAALTKIAGQWGRVWCRVSSNGTDYILSGDMA